MNGTINSDKSGHGVIINCSQNLTLIMKIFMQKIMTIFIYVFFQFHHSPNSPSPYLKLFARLTRLPFR